VRPDFSAKSDGAGEYHRANGGQHMSTRKLLALAVLVGLTAIVTDITVQRAGAAQRTGATVRGVDAAKAFLATLDERQRAKVALPLDATTRTIWSNLPTGIKMQVGATERNGLKFGDMTPTQQQAALSVVAAVLSRTGYQKVLNIVNADQHLEETSAPTRPADSRVRFGRAEYYLALLGKPSAADRWMLQFGGHHLAINVTVFGRDTVLTPTHTGAQPASFVLNGETVRPLGNENDKAFALMNALDAAQQKQALLGYQVRNLVLGPGEDGKVIQPEGIRGSALNARQRAMLADLISEWVTILNEDAAAAKMKDVQAALGETYFAWAGSTTNGKEAYFRVQGPTAFIEYAPQGQANAPSTDHIHTIYRDPTNDYGSALPRR
jgi:hypothetical protein